jgi:hypothetical protein
MRWERKYVRGDSKLWLLGERKSPGIACIGIKDNYCRACRGKGPILSLLRLVIVGSNIE